MAFGDLVASALLFSTVSVFILYVVFVLYVSWGSTPVFTRTPDMFGTPLFANLSWWPPTPGGVSATSPSCIGPVTV